jgi:hypothetical protein
MVSIGPAAASSGAGSGLSSCALRCGDECARGGATFFFRAFALTADFFLEAVLDLDLDLDFTAAFFAFAFALDFGLDFDLDFDFLAIAILRSQLSAAHPQQFSRRSLIQFSIRATSG